MPRKAKLPPISPERQAIFDAEGFGAKQAAKIHAELCALTDEQFHKMAGWYEVEWTDRETTGNAIIKGYTQRQRDFYRGCAERAFARDKWSDYFYSIFGAPLRSYWEGNATGLDVIRLDADLVQPPDGTSTRDHLRATRGPVAVQMVHELLHGIPDRQPRVEVLAPC